MKSKYVYHKENKYIRCKVTYEESFNGIRLQLQKKNFIFSTFLDRIFYTFWHDTSRGVDVQFKDNADDVDRSNKLNRYLNFNRDLKTYQTREDALTSAIDELFEKYISDKENKQKEKDIYNKL